MALSTGCGGAVAHHTATTPSPTPAAPPPVQIAAIAPPGPTVNPDSARTGLQVLIAPEPHADVFRDRRTLRLGKGILRVSLRGVPSDLDAASVRLRTLTEGAGLALIDVRFYPGGVTPQTLLEPYVGKEVIVHLSHEDGPHPQAQAGLLLGISKEGPIVSFGGQTGVVDFARIGVPRLPEGLRAEPTLELLVSNDRGEGEQDLELTYQSHEVDAGMEYQLVRAPGAATGELVGLASVENRSTTPLADASLAMTSEAGEAMDFGTEPVARAAGGAPEDAAARGAASTTLVRFPAPLTVAPGERALARLFGPTPVSLTRKVVVEGPGLPIGAGEEFPNASMRVALDAVSPDGASISATGLVAGNAHLFERADNEPPRAFGDASTRPLPGTKGVRIDLGPETKFPSRRRLLSRRNLGRCVTESAWDVSIGNPTEAPQFIEDVEPVTGRYEVLDSSVPALAKEVDHFVFGLAVPAGGETHLKFRVRTLGCVPARRHYWQNSSAKSWSKKS